MSENTNRLLKHCEKLTDPSICPEEMQKVFYVTCGGILYEAARGMVEMTNAGATQVEVWEHIISQADKMMIEGKRLGFRDMLQEERNDDASV